MAAAEGLPATLVLEIVTPDHSLVTENVDELVAPAAEGYLGVLPGHTPLLATLSTGELWYRKGRQRFFLAVVGGFLEVLPEKVTVLAQIAERAEQIDVGRAQRAKQRAEERLSKATVDVDVARAQASLLRATVRLQVAALAATGRSSSGTPAPSSMPA
jgi:F-type H+-transporting ATPase subunit epsilon